MKTNKKLTALRLALLKWLSKPGCSCPHCGYEHKQDEFINNDLYDELVCWYICEQCEEKFNVEVLVFYQWRTVWSET